MIELLLLQEQPDYWFNVQRLTSLGNAYMGVGEYSKAEDIFLKLVADHPYSFEINTKLVSHLEMKTLPRPNLLRQSIGHPT